MSGQVGILELRDSIKADVLAALQAPTARDAQVGLGISELGTCRRAVAYTVGGHPQTNPQVSGIASTLGRYIHDGLLRDLRRLWRGAKIEQEVLFEWEELPPIPGHYDIYRRPTKLLVDLKTNTTYGLGKPLSTRNLWQVMTYAAAQIAAGNPVEWVAVVRLAREGWDEPEVILLPFDPQVVADAVAWYAEAVSYAANPQDAPRDGQGPGIDKMCDWCTHSIACWGAWPEGVKPQAALVQDPEGVADAVRMLVDARTRKKAAERDEEFAKAMLSGTPKGTYGGINFNPVEGKRHNLDTDAILMLLRDLGWRGTDLPKKPTPTLTMRAQPVKGEAAATAEDE